jgi:aerobic-type carbon monoxide dehydrogenase small subunit (CoxS/CutS family)
VSEETRVVKTTINVRVNGEDQRVEVDTRMIVADMLRERLRLTGVHIGCATGNCGACTVVLDGRTVKSCWRPTSTAPRSPPSRRSAPARTTCTPSSRRS